MSQLSSSNHHFQLPTPNSQLSTSNSQLPTRTLERARYVALSNPRAPAPVPSPDSEPRYIESKTGV